MKQLVLPILPLLIACAPEPPVRPDLGHYDISASVDRLRTSTNIYGRLFSVLVEEGVGFESMGCAGMITREPFSHWNEARIVLASCSTLSTCSPLTLSDGFRAPVLSVVRLQLYAVLALDEEESLWLLDERRPPVLPGDLYGVSRVFEVQPGQASTSISEPILLDQVFQGCP